MDIERVELCKELLKKSGKVDFWINKEVYDYKNVGETVRKLTKQYGLNVSVMMNNELVHIIVEVE